ncbi:hypothetical protein GCM10023318_29130 [Nocardia callitridis]|uniref:Uncharacterized protein n=2 Tax=Nocardia callitridis TaxID=648753 RepID=A0ABP9KBZ1_9NOCA
MVAGGQAVSAAGGPSKLGFQCSVVHHVPAGMLDCPVNPATERDGCSVEYYELRWWNI